MIQAISVIIKPHKTRDLVQPSWKNVITIQNVVLQNVTVNPYGLFEWHSRITKVLYSVIWSRLTEQIPHFVTWVIALMLHTLHYILGSCFSLSWMLMSTAILTFCASFLFKWQAWHDDCQLVQILVCVTGYINLLMLLICCFIFVSGIIILVRCMI